MKLEGNFIMIFKSGFDDTPDRLPINVSKVVLSLSENAGHDGRYHVLKLFVNNKDLLISLANSLDLDM